MSCRATRRRSEPMSANDTLKMTGPEVFAAFAAAQGTGNG
jgi:hypothetical protein